MRRYRLDIYARTGRMTECAHYPVKPHTAHCRDLVEQYDGDHGVLITEERRGRAGSYTWHCVDTRRVHVR